METSTKATYHKSCSCGMCRRNRAHFDRNRNERKFRRRSARELLNYVLKGADDVHIHPISSPYTD
jgi:hypothetical protein